MNRVEDIQKYYMRAKRRKVSEPSCTVISDVGVQVSEHEQLVLGPLESSTADANKPLSDYDNVTDHIVNTYEPIIVTTDGFNNVPSSLENHFCFKLKEWALQHNITHGAINDLLYLLNSTSLPDNVPLDARTLLGTSRTISTKSIEPGKYYHFGLRHCLEKLYNMLVDFNNTSTLVININIDGLPLSKSSSSQVYPILCNIVGCNRVEMVGIYHGYEKPKDSNLFLSEFVNDATDVINNGIIIKGKLYQVRIKGIICDAPAKAYVKCIKSHTGYSSCTKCQVVGSYIENRVCFPNVDNNSQLRNDAQYRSKFDEDHHNGTSVIENIPYIDMICSFPLDYMHLICLGVMRKLLLLWCCGKPSTKLSFQKISNISFLLKQCSTNVPSEFNRKPRGLNEIRRWKATEFRQFLCYTGPIVLKDNISRDRYNNFMSLHVAVIILSHSQHVVKIEYAAELLKYFVKTFKILYGPENMSHNIHNLLHITDDVKYHGVLDQFSAFPFENYLQSILKSLRKCDKPLEQIIKRHSEKQNENYSYINVKTKCSIYKSERNGSSYLANVRITSHSKSLSFENFSLTIQKPNNCCCLKNGEVIIIKDFVQNGGKYKLLGNKYLNVTSFYTSPCESADLGIFEAKSTNLDVDNLFEIEDIVCKCINFNLDVKSIIVPIIHANLD